MHNVVLHILFVNFVNIKQVLLC